MLTSQYITLPYQFLIGGGLCYTEQIYCFFTATSPPLTLFTPTYRLTSTFPFSHRAAAWSFNLLYSPPTSHPNMSLPLPLTCLLLISSYSITSYTAAVLKRTSPTELHYLSYITRLVLQGVFVEIKVKMRRCSVKKICKEQTNMIPSGIIMRY